MMTKEQVHAEAELRIHRAMKLVEQAQMGLGKACSELSNVMRWSPECDAVNKEYDRVHKLWYRLHNKLMRGKRLELDDIAIQALEKKGG